MANPQSRTTKEQQEKYDTEPYRVSKFYLPMLFENCYCLKADNEFDWNDIANVILKNNPKLEEDEKYLQLFREFK